MTSPTFSAFSSGFDSFYHAFPAAGQQFFDSQSSPNQPFLFPGTSHEAMQWKSLQDTTKEHETLSAQLSRLDRYMAIHSWDLDPQSKKSLVEQRMSLVRELDAVRLHKEQLELILAQLRPGTSDVHREGPVDIQMLPAQYLTGSVANSQNYIAPRTFFATANHAAPNLSTFTLADTLPSMLSTHESFEGGSPRQSKDDRNSSGTGSDFGPMPTEMKMNVPHETGPWYGEQTMARGSSTSKQNAQVQAVNAADAKSTVGNGDGWTTPTKSAPPDIRRIYRRIEEASKQGDSMEELLKELAAATTRLVQRCRVERDGSPHPPLRRTDRASLNSQLDNDTIPIPGGSIDVGVHSQPARLAARRLWKSENGHLQRPSNILGATSFGTDDEDDGKSCSSYESTVDSWATIEEGDKRWVQREMLKGETDDEDESSSQDSAIESILENTEMVASQASNTRDTIDWVRKTKPGGEGTNKECDNSSFDHTKGTQAHSNSEAGKPICSQLLTQYFNKERGIVSQKSAALTVSHNVNAHAYLPSFDGACDSPCWSEGSQASESHLDHGFSQKDVSQNPNQENQWYIPKKRIKPSPAVLREFFRRVEEEERNMIRQYQIMGSIPR
ncbi:hypothetical protein ASPWEDRAFT_38853 [Aspergillus wentii DTO 134E9]|uniref:Uncharacterized protein n=1 Tax=Aspergillus wentii DTO 134E9 TaxID=1073089 RepID=A0A1L9RQJ0_ASPWE|nr:uncharacterized protein ASPWEDRAFT_38853 [Aspergillus wentii DTO 134E9]OJJ37199.1 hypothetical protein ASPWEDRAFT_38853 [Aspergillus wentii DTO 134E9]